MDGLTQGASIEVFASHVSLGSFCNCWGAVHVNLPRALNLNEGITSKQTMINAATKCNVALPVLECIDRLGEVSAVQ
jgi:hypothetical protein